MPRKHEQGTVEYRTLGLFSTHGTYTYCIYDDTPPPPQSNSPIQCVLKTTRGARFPAGHPASAAQHIPEKAKRNPLLYSVPSKKGISWLLGYEANLSELALRCWKVQPFKPRRTQLESCSDAPHGRLRTVSQAPTKDLALGTYLSKTHSHPSKKHCTRIPIACWEKESRRNCISGSRLLFRFYAFKGSI